MPIVIPPFPPPPRPTATPISVLAQQVLARVQDPTAIFWDLSLEVYPALVEALNDLMLIIGRPTTIYATPVQLNPRIVWQPMPANMLAITNIRTNFAGLWKTSLHSMDYLQTSWMGNWETDVAAVPVRWGPIGVSHFFVHPAPEQTLTVTVTGVGYPVPSAVFPPTGTETASFHDEFFQALELYAAAYLRLKELGDDAQEGQELYQQYLQIAQRLTRIEDRKDSLVFSQAFGTPTALSRVTRR
jgi:hypothetical protein